MDDFQLNIDNNDEQEQNNIIPESTQNKIGLAIIIFISIFIVFFNFYQVVYIIRLLKRAYTIIPHKIFEECYLYNGFSDLLLELYSFFLGLDLLILCAFPFFDANFDFFMDKFGSILIYLNYLVFGPFSIGILVLCLLHSDKLLFVCIRGKPENKIFNFKLIFLLFMSSLFSLLITITGIIYFGNATFNSSIAFKPNGNNLLGYIFWKYGLSHSRRFRNGNNNNNANLNINNNVLLNDENINLIN